MKSRVPDPYYLDEFQQHMDTQQKIDAIKRAQAVIEFDINGNILSANENFLLLTGYATEEVIGRHHSMLVPKNEVGEQSYKDFWASLAKGEFRSGEFKRITKSGDDIWVHATYTPTRNDKGHVMKIVKIASDITHSRSLAARDAAQRRAIEQSHAVAEFDPSGIVRWANDRFLKLLGYQYQEVIGQHHRMFVDPLVSRSPEYAVFWASLRGGAQRTDEFMRLRKDGREVWMQATYAPIHDDTGAVTGVVKIATDVTEERQRNARSRAKISAIEHSHAAVEFDLNGNIIAVNERFVALMGYTEAEIIGQHHSLFMPKAEARRSEYQEFWEKLRAGIFMTGRFRRVARGGREVWVEGTYTVIRDAAGEPVGIFKFARDITSEVTAKATMDDRRREDTKKLRATQKELEKRAHTDPLTGLANRRQLDLELTTRCHESDVVLIRCDLDRFKQVNDVLGHAAGDYVLKNVAATLKRNTNKRDLVCRVGGDEFVILCAEGTAEEDGERIAQRMLTALGRPVFYKNKRCVFGASFGVSSGRRGQVTGSDLLSYADAALYKAKAAGRGTVTLFDNALLDRLERERDLAEDVLRAIENNQLIPYAQTVHDAKTFELIGIEILARWRHGRHGILTPAEFFPILRQMGLEGDLDAVIFKSAIEGLTALEANGLRIPRVSFNVSAERVTHPGFAEWAQQTVGGLNAQVSFEILETISSNEPNDLLKTAIGSLRQSGFRIEIDDFGSGYASLTSTLSIVPDGIKIDREIAGLVTESDCKRMLVKSTIEIGRALGIAVTAEGVETLEQATLLRDLGCDALQGFHFCQPMPLAEIGDFMSDMASGKTLQAVSEFSEEDLKRANTG